MTSYETIYNRFAQKITDYKLLELSDTDVHDMLHSWLVSAISKFRRCNVDLSQRDEEIECFSVDLSDQEIEILSILMVSEWLEPQVSSVLYTSQFFGGKEEKLWRNAHGSLCSETAQCIPSYMLERPLEPQCQNGKMKYAYMAMDKKFADWEISREISNRDALNDYGLEYPQDKCPK